MRTLTALALLVSLGTLRAEDAYPGDKVFIRQVALHGMFDVTAGELAVNRSTSAVVKEFGAKIALDRRKISEELRLMARNKGWELPERLDTRHEAKLEQLTEEPVKDFDRDFIAEMAEITRIDNESFQNAAKYAADENLRSWAAKSQPTLVDDFLTVPKPALVTTVTVKER